MYGQLILRTCGQYSTPCLKGVKDRYASCTRVFTQTLASHRSSILEHPKKKIFMKNSMHVYHTTICREAV